ncbi:MAG: FliH/SctL family protein [Ectobacillus sp.]
MSLFKNRIPGNSVSFSNEHYQLKYMQEETSRDELNIFDERFPDKEAFLREKNELLKEKEELLIERNRLQEFEKMLRQQQENLMMQKQAFEEQKVQYMRQFEQEKKQIYYEMTELLWDNSLKLAEKIVNQAIDTRQLSMIAILKGMIQTLPIAFEKLQITVHPQTYKLLEEEKEETKEYWLFELVEWKYDFSLAVGEFVLEEEKEYFEYRFRSIFERLREKLGDRMSEEVKAE